MEVSCMSRYEKILGSDHRNSAPKKGVTGKTEIMEPKKVEPKIKKEEEIQKTIPGTMPETRSGVIPGVPLETVPLEVISPAISSRPIFKDPRPDLDEKYKDSVIWTIFLEVAYDMDPELYGRLVMFRCQGTVLKKVQGQKWNYVLSPVIDPAGDIAWRSKKEYDTEKRKWLDPFREEVVKLLGRI